MTLTKLAHDLHDEVDVEEVIKQPAFLDHDVAKYVAETDSVDVCLFR